MWRLTPGSGATRVWRAWLAWRAWRAWTRPGSRGMLLRVPRPDRRDTAEQVLCETRAQWRDWLQDQHQRPDGVWLVTWRRQSGRPQLGYEEAVEEALCFGWVDSTGRSLDADRTMLWFAPRRPGSGWARTNKDRVARLEVAGLMDDAGRRAVQRARDDGSWSLLDDVEALVVPADLAAALDASPPARSQWETFPPSARRALLAWIVQAKRPQTREKRIAETSRAAARGERANDWRPHPNQPK